MPDLFVGDLPTTGSIIPGLPKSRAWGLWYFNNFCRDEDFVLSSDSTSHWLLAAETATGIPVHDLLTDNPPQGILQITTGTANNDLEQIYRRRTPIILSATNKTYFEVRMLVPDPSSMNVYIGLSAADTTNPNYSSLMIRIDEGDGKLALYGDDGVAAETSDIVGSPSATLWYTAGFIHDPTVPEVQPYLDGSSTGLTAISTRIPTDTNLYPQLYMLNASASARTTYIDYIFVAQE